MIKYKLLTSFNEKPQKNIEKIPLRGCGVIFFSNKFLDVYGLKDAVKVQFYYDLESYKCLIKFLVKKDLKDHSSERKITSIAGGKTIRFTPLLDFLGITKFKYHMFNYKFNSIKKTVELDLKFLVAVQ